MKATGKYSDQELLQGIKEHNEAIVTHIYSYYFSSIRLFVLSNKGNESDAKDVFQDALIVMYRRLKEEDFSLTSKLSTYIFGIAKYIWFNELQKKKVRNVPDIEFEEVRAIDSNMEQRIIKHERQSLYRNLFNQMNNKCKRLLRMFLEDYALSSITEEMGYSSDHVTKNKRLICKKSLEELIRSNVNYKNLVNEKFRVN